MTRASTARRAKRVAKKSTASNGAKKLNKDEAEKLIGMDRALAQRKISLANIEIEIERLSKQKRQILSEIRRGTEAFGDEAKSMAEAHGIDTDDESVKWKLDLTEMKFELDG